MSQRRLILLASLGSAALLLGAFVFQYIGGYPPCKMCYWQRWPHAAAVLMGAALLIGGPRLLIWAGALAAAATSFIGAYHAGVEWKWWPGPASCSGGGSLGGLSGADLLSTDAPSGIVMCNDIVWQLFGLSMAGWNAVISAGLITLWIMAAKRG